MNKVAKKVAVVDYGMGNLRSVAQAVIHAATDTGVDVVITASPQQVLDADGHAIDYRRPTLANLRGVLAACPAIHAEALAKLGALA